MGEAETSHDTSQVSDKMPSFWIYANLRIHRRVLNTFRTMITDEDVLEKGDMYILDRIRDFCVKAEATTSVAAVKQLVVLIDRVVSAHVLH